MTEFRVSGIEPGERRLDGPQTTGREYRNLSRPCRSATVRYRIPIVPNARRFEAGRRIRLYLTSDDQDQDKPALMNFRHASVGTSSLNTVLSSSRLLLPIAPKSR